LIIKTTGKMQGRRYIGVCGGGGGGGGGGRGGGGGGGGGVTPPIIQNVGQSWSKWKIFA
jgi:hypothetical protein